MLANPAGAATADGTQRERAGPAGPLDRYRALAAGVANDGLNLEVFNRSQRNAPALNEGKRGAYEVARKPGPNGGR